MRVMRMVLRSGPSATTAMESTLSMMVDAVVEGAGVDVPGVVLLGGVGEGLELVAAGVGGEVLVCS